MTQHGSGRTSTFRRKCGDKSAADVATRSKNRLSVGVRLAFKPKAGITVRGAVLDGVPVDRPDAR
jgi:hypothetical protein